MVWCARGQICLRRCVCASPAVGSSGLQCCPSHQAWHSRAAVLTVDRACTSQACGDSTLAATPVDCLQHKVGCNVLQVAKWRHVPVCAPVWAGACPQQWHVKTDLKRHWHGSTCEPFWCITLWSFWIMPSVKVMQSQAEMLLCCPAIACRLSQASIPGWDVCCLAAGVMFFQPVCWLPAPL